MKEQEYLHKLLNYLRKAAAMLRNQELITDKILCDQISLYIEYREEDEKDFLLQMEKKLMTDIPFNIVAELKYCLKSLQEIKEMQRKICREGSELLERIDIVGEKSTFIGKRLYKVLNEVENND